MTSMTEHFIGEAIKPVADTFNAAGMSAGGPGLPRQFRWRKQVFTVARVLKTCAIPDLAITAAARAMFASIGLKCSPKAARR